MTGTTFAEVEFRRSRRRVVGFLAGFSTLMLPLFSLFNVTFGEAWYDPLPYLPMLFLTALGFYAELGRQSGLPLTVTRDHLVLTRVGEEPLAIGWDNLAVATIRGRITPTLVLEVADPARTRPVLDRWAWAQLGQWSLSRINRPHEIHVSLVGLTPGVRRLRALLADRLADAGNSVHDGRPQA